MHIAKYTKVQAGPLLSHYENSIYRSHSSAVNPERTHLNITYKIDGEYKRGHDRLKEFLDRDDVYCSPRADIKVMFDTVITAPNQLPKEREQEFFNYAVRFIADRFPTAQVLSINIHYDENSYYDEDGINSGAPRPHIHIAMLPSVLCDKNSNAYKKGYKYKISAKETITKETLLTLHQDFKNYIDVKMNLNLDILTGATENGNKSILELKNESLSKDIDKQKDDIEKLKKLKSNLKTSIEHELIR